LIVSGSSEPRTRKVIDPRVTPAVNQLVEKNSLRGVAGPLIGPSAYFMKSPPVQFSDEAAREMVEEFILGNGASKAADWTAFFDIEPAEA